MLIYILKFSACLFIFMAFYKLFLERETMHQLKRFYLLFALVLSIGFPLITFTQFVEPVTITQNFTNAQQIVFEHEAIEQTSLWGYLPQLLWTVYGIGVLIFSLKFVLNLNVIFKKIHCNPKLKAHRYINVLLNDEVTPHTFFNYIFLNKYKYESQQIPQEVFIHEQTHAEQKHSLDILFIELLQILFWFNPLLYFIKRDIKLNHEFLADKAVLLNGIQPSQYQQLLLAFSSNTNEPQLANAINYSSIKKRFTIMKTHTSKKAIYLRTMLLLPLMAVILYGFSGTKVIETIPILPDEVFQKSLDNQRAATEDIKVSINKKSQLLVQDELVALEDLKNYLSKINVHLSTEQKQSLIRSTIYVESATPKNIINAVNQILTDYGAARIDIVGPYHDSNHEGATREQVSQFNSFAQKYNKQPKASRIISIKDLKVLEDIYGKMSEKQKRYAEPFPNSPAMSVPPEIPKEPKVKERVKNDILPPTLANAHEGMEDIMELEKQVKIRKQEVLIEIQESRTEEQEEFPAPPAIAYLVHHKTPSKELKNIINDYSKRSKAYRKAVGQHWNNGQGNKTVVKNQYKELLLVYQEFKKKATAEGVFAYPAPAFSSMPARAKKVLPLSQQRP